MAIEMMVNPLMNEYEEQEELFKKHRKTLRKSNPFLFLYAMVSLSLASLMMGILIGSLYGSNWF